MLSCITPFDGTNAKEVDGCSVLIIDEDKLSDEEERGTIAASDEDE